MAIRSVATSDTLEGFRTTFNTLGTDVGDLTNLNTAEQGSIVGALNEVLTATSTFTLRDESSSTQTIGNNDILNIIGDTNINASVSATDRLTISMNSSITGLTSVSATTLTDGTATISGGTINATTITENSIQVATKPFAIAQAIALG